MFGLTFKPRRSVQAAWGFCIWRFSHLWPTESSDVRISKASRAPRGVDWVVYHLLVANRSLGWVWTLLALVVGSVDRVERVSCRCWQTIWRISQAFAEVVLIVNLHNLSIRILFVRSKGIIFDASVGLVVFAIDHVVLKLVIGLLLIGVAICLFVLLICPSWSDLRVFIISRQTGSLVYMRRLTWFGSLS